MRDDLGAVAVIGDLNFVNMLAKTRSGKIMRRVLKAVTLDRDPGDITTIEDETSVEEARHAWSEMKQDIASNLLPLCTYYTPPRQNKTTNRNCLANKPFIGM